MSESYFSSQPSPEEIEMRMSGYPSWFEVDLDSLGFNLEHIRKRVDVEIIPCVKANAYGHGAVPIVAYLMKKGVKKFLVAKLWEAMQLKEAGLDCGVINMDPLLTAEQFKTVVANDIIQIVFNRSTIEGINEAAFKLSKEAKVFVNVETGLNRVGIGYENAADMIEYISTLPSLIIMGIFSSLTEDKDFDKVQLNRMLVLDKELKKRGIQVPVKSVASSKAIFHFPEACLGAVRPGIMLYGLYPDPEDKEVDLDLKPLISFKARLEHVKWIEEGESVTYGRKFVAPKKMKVGTIHVGYSDGFPQGLTKKGIVRVGDMIKPVLGVVSINHHVVDLDGTDVKMGDIIELVSRDGENTLGRLAVKAGISVYRFCVSFNPLIPRVYYENGVLVALSELKLVGA